VGVLTDVRRRAKRCGIASFALSSLLLFGSPSIEAQTQTQTESQVDPTKLVCPESYCSSINLLTANEKAAMIGVVWRKGCPVSLDDLRAVRVLKKSFGGFDSVGTVVVHKRFAAKIEQVFHELYDAGYPIESMQPIEAFGGNDDRSTMANNTSAFNCRAVTGGKRYSEHAYGRAIDINPVQNPYVYRNGTVLDPKANPFVDRLKTANEPGVISRNGVVVRAFEKIGWRWGGNFATTKDYQHFSATGR
jgi:hypothetical protein